MDKKVEVNVRKDIGRGFLVNMGAIFQTLTLIIMILAWKEVLIAVQTLPKEFRIIGIMIWFILITKTMRFPNVIGNTIDDINMKVN